jgi:hypothetical protein
LDRGADRLRQFDGYAQLTAELKTPIQIGENFYGPRDLYTALQRKACDLVMPDFMRIGGVTGWLKASAIAGAAGIPMSTHLYPEVAAQVMRVTETAHWQNGRTGPIRSCRSPAKFVTDCFTFLTCLGLVLNGTRKRWRPTKPICKLIVPDQGDKVKPSNPAI